MSLVLDASVALKWFVREDGTASALTLAGREDLIAPDLLVAEVANGLWKMEQVGRLPAKAVDLAMTRLPRYFRQLAPVEPLAARALEIARELGHPVYDCFYLALAEQAKTSLVTADSRLLERLAGMPLAALAASLATFDPGQATPRA
jgi:predicted nucleic acid-binding protein